MNPVPHRHPSSTRSAERRAPERPDRGRPSTAEPPAGRRTASLVGRVLPAAALAVAALLPTLPAQAAPAPSVSLATATATATATASDGTAELSGQACADGEGVTVVVDLTDLGEDVRVGCAQGDPATGREALEGAGFTTTDSVPGMICAVDGLPDPCPEEFDGNYWAYFTAEPGGEWTARTEGADTADPAPGSFEGWRYNDGSAGPGVTTTELATAPAAGGTNATSAPASDETSTDAAGSTVDAGADQSEGPSTGLVVGLGAAAVAVIAAVVLLRRRRAA